MSYCQFIQALPKGERKDLHQRYHDQHYGFPIHEDKELFARLVLEINQAGLSWETILKKEAAFREAYDHFDIATVAAYGDKERERLLSNAGIIRNKLKVNAAIENAREILDLQKEWGSFKNWLDQQHPLSKEEWVKLFKQHFRFVGGEIVNEFLMSTGYLKGAHTEDCPVHQELIKKKPQWLIIT
jgi:DNA-3-methyladenine glycosylase I